ncbi:MAG: OmpA family protein [Bacteroidales bacterium]|jgi:outer membrane protein OmpA-like peptidoglycan-associated protein/tetratricopeptide (TPR) repeat protein
MKKRIYFLFFLQFLFIFSFSQTESNCPEINNRKAIKLYSKGIETYNTARNPSEIREAITLFNQAIEEEPQLPDAYFALAKINFKNQSLKEAEKYLLKTIELCPSYNNEAYFQLGEIYLGRADHFYESGNFQESAKNFVNAAKNYFNYLQNLKTSNKKTSDDKKLEIERKYETSKLIGDLLSHPVPFNPKPVEGICTKDDEALSIITPDNELALYTKRFKKEPYPDYIEQFMYNEAVNGKFGTGYIMKAPFNQGTNEGGATLTADNLHMFFVISKKETTTKTEKGVTKTNEYFNSDIYYSDNINGQWTEPKSIGDNVNSPDSWESHPSVSADGMVLYFSSNRLGGFGGCDLYKIEKNEKGVWGKPINLGPTINTAGDEVSPFIHTDSQTLYFSSNGHDGLGGLDIFYTKQNEKGEWTTPKNLGFPINSIYDDESFFVSTDGKTGYFSSDRKDIKGKGGIDLYSFPLYEDVRPERVLFAKGQLKDEKTGLPIKATIDIKSVDGKKIKEISVDTNSGKYVVAMAFKDDYVLTVKKEGYVYDSRYFAKDDTTYQTPKAIELEVKPIEVGESYRINDIYFSTNSSELTNSSKIVLNEFFDFLKENPNMRISIQGHTDDIGSESDNLALSENRARAVQQYLIFKGVEPTRMEYKGFGESQPVATNETAGGRAKNRRTVFVILNK